MASCRHLAISVVVAGLFAHSSVGQETQETTDSATIAAEALPDAETTPKTIPFQLGLTVNDSPGIGVQVIGVLWGGPAGRAGIRSGDYVMSVAGASIKTPTDLREAVRSADADTKLEIGIWRKGETLSKTIDMDAKFTDSTREKAWLGVALQMTDGGNVLIANVLPASPASNGGLRVGDTLLRVDAENVDSAEELLQLMKRIKAGDNVAVTVLRNGQERTFTVRVGSAVHRTMRWFEDHFPRDELQRRWSEFDPPEVDVERYRESFEGMLDRLREEMRELRDEVHRLREPSKDT